MNCEPTKYRAPCETLICSLYKCPTDSLELLLPHGQGGTQSSEDCGCLGAGVGVQGQQAGKQPTACIQPLWLMGYFLRLACEWLTMAPLPPFLPSQLLAASETIRACLRTGIRTGQRLSGA